jgi:hypothetical protein
MVCRPTIRTIGTSIRTIGTSSPSSRGLPVDGMAAVRLIAFTPNDYVRCATSDLPMQRLGGGIPRVSNRSRRAEPGRHADEHGRANGGFLSGPKKSATASSRSSRRSHPRLRSHTKLRLARLSRHSTRVFPRVEASERAIFLARDSGPSGYPANIAEDREDREGRMLIPSSEAGG